MGPPALYDKSFLQLLNLDEAVMFDTLFYPVTCPIFYAETLANLEKQDPQGRLSEDVVSALARKTPEMHGGPSMHHRGILECELFGHAVPMNGQIIIAGGRHMRKAGQTSVVFQVTKEAEAFARWQNGEFLELEKRFAKAWRDDLKVVDLHEIGDRATRYGIDLANCKSLEQAKTLAGQVIGSLSSEQQIAFAIEHFRLRGIAKSAAIHCWQATGRRPLADYAPYAHHVLLVDVFSEIALATGKISPVRNSSINDLAYLYYLPFCKVFVSNDRLHRDCAPLFMRVDQEFVWGESLKVALRENHETLTRLPEDERDRGLLALHPDPSGEFIQSLVDRLLAKREGEVPAREWKVIDVSPELADYIRRNIDPSIGDTGDECMPTDEVDSMEIHRRVRGKRGAWFQTPKSQLRPDEET